MDTKAVSDTLSDKGDRRKAPRQPTDRPALFIAHRGSGPLREGGVKDFSRDGLQIVTQVPEALGTQVQVEIPPSLEGANSNLIMLTGCVARLTEQDDAAFAMGLRIVDSAPVVQDDLTGELLAPALTKSRDSQGQESHPAHRMQQEIPRTVTRYRVRGFAAALLMVLVALLLAALFLVGDTRSTRAQGLSGAFGSFAMMLDDEPLPIRRPDTGGSQPMTPIAGHLPGDLVPVPERPELVPVIRPVAPGNLYAPASDGFTTGQATDTLRDKPVWAGPADHSSIALAIFSDPEVEPGNHPEEAGATDVDPVVRNRPSADSTVVEMPDPKVITSALAATDEGPALMSEPLFIVVDKAAYALTVVKNGQPVRSFPVGLGIEDVTPEGVFHIGLKATNPNWYDGSRIVQAGAPDNPLGRRWMGLVSENAPTSYGIHPTDDKATIGVPSSRGCIRMQPEDADTVFRLCPSGTPVYIHPGLCPPTGPM